jgi:hypothetical protein
MLAKAELDYLFWLASERNGRICELGCFLGGSTWALATGRASRADAADLPSILTYDAFLMDKETAAQFPVGYSAGQSFRPLFERYLAPHLGGIIVREGFIPRDLPVDREPEVYPEQGPIDILFNDAAKTWLVHNTILRGFGRHLVPGQSVFIQQDFKHFGGYWIPLHMWQLRECFEPLHDIAGGATHTFLYRGGLAEHLSVLWAPGSLTGAQIEATWGQVETFWSAAPAVAWFMVLCRATHLAADGQADACIKALERVASGCRPVVYGADGVILAVEFVQACEMAERLLSRGTLAPTRRSRLTELRNAGLPGDATSCADNAVIWERAARRLAVRGLRTIALYGAGRHTADLLRSGWPGPEIKVAAVLDDYATSGSIVGVPVVQPASAPAVDAVVISSRAHEEQLAQAAARVFDARVPVIRMYGAVG